MKKKLAFIFETIFTEAFNFKAIFGGFAGSEVTGCTFTGNVINTPSATDKRVASAIFFGTSS